MAETVNASIAALGAPSTTPQATPEGAVAEPGWTKRAMRTIVKATGQADTLEAMTSPLSGIPVEKRRHAAATVGLFSVLFVAIGAVAATGRTSAAAPVFSVVALLLAVLLGLIAWGITRSVRIDVADARLDAAIEATLADRPEYQTLCSCGHDHDPTELHVVDEDVHEQEACSHDGSGATCGHDCSSCVMAALRPSPNRTRADRLT
jgi:hypothetical protein